MKNFINQAANNGMRLSMTIMKVNKIVLLAVALTAIFISSCKKDVLQTSETQVTRPYESLQDFYDIEGAGASHFTITPDLVNTITGPQGTRIRIPANSLRDSVGLPPPGDVNVTLREVYDIKTMVLSHIPTTSNGNILQSGGMIYLQFNSGAVRYHPVNGLEAWMPIDP